MGTGSLRCLDTGAGPFNGMLYVAIILLEDAGESCVGVIGSGCVVGRGDDGFFLLDGDFFLTVDFLLLDTFLVRVIPPM